MQAVSISKEKVAVERARRSGAKEQRMQRLVKHQQQMIRIRTTARVKARAPTLEEVAPATAAATTATAASRGMQLRRLYARLYASEMEATSGHGGDDVRFKGTGGARREDGWRGRGRGRHGPPRCAQQHDCIRPLAESCTDWGL